MDCSRIPPSTPLIPKVAMPPITPYKFTEEQEQAIGQLVADRWGDNFQTSFDDHTGHPVLYSQTGPSHAVRRARIAPDGTVLFEE